MELERQAHLKDYGPILALPYKGRKGWIRPDIDETGQLEWVAFGSVGFTRQMAKLNKLRYKIDRLKEELADETIFIGIIRDRIPGKAKYVVLKQLKMGLIVEHITAPEVRSLARHSLRAWRLRQEIRDVSKSSTGPVDSGRPAQYPWGRAMRCDSIGCDVRGGKNWTDVI